MHVAVCRGEVMLDASKFNGAESAAKHESGAACAESALEWVDRMEGGVSWTTCGDFAVGCCSFHLRLLG